MLANIPLTFLLIIEDQARRTLFKTGTASVASKKTELGVWEALPQRGCF